MPQSHSTASARTTRSTATRSTATRSTTTRRADAVALLKADHSAVQKLFKQYDKLAKDEAPQEERQALAQQICRALELHATLEEELVYPAAREMMPKAELIDEAEVEHASAKALIAEIRAMQPDQPLYDAKVKVLGEYVQHHVKEEHDEIFPAMRKAKMDLREIGEQIKERKRALQAERGDGRAGIEH